MLPLRPVQTERWMPRRRILEAELSSSLKKWNLRLKRLLFHRPLESRLLQVRENTLLVTVTFVSTFSFRSFSSLFSDLIISPRSLRYRDMVLKNS